MFLLSTFRIDFNTNCFRLKSIHLCRLFMRLQWFYFYESFKTTVAQSTTKELLSRGSYRAKYYFDHEENAQEDFALV